jgi:hypothetical protein
MVDDIRPGGDLPKDKNTNQTDNQLSTAEVQALRAPSLAAKEDGFVQPSASVTANRFQIHKPHIWFKHASKKEKIIGGIIIFALVVGGGGGVYALKKHFGKATAVSEQPVTKQEEPPKPTTEASKLTGVQISPDLNKRPITGVMIENSPDARPQAGLVDAGIVFEAIAEGGITRFLALFQEGQPEYLGPVRSVRPYYVDFLLPFDAALAHAGGSAEGLAKVRNLGVKDLDHGNTGGAYRRVSDRYAPHNLYTSMGDLDKASQQKGFTTSNSKSLPRKAEQPGQAVTARTIDLNISSVLYNVHYDYDVASNTYKRTLGGRPHVDHRSGQQLSPKVVVALVMGYSQKGIYSVYQTTGSGTMFVFQDGVVHQGTWKKAGEKEQFEFVDAAGKTLALNPGQTWISIVKAPDAVRSAP